MRQRAIYTLLLAGAAISAAVIVGELAGNPTAPLAAGPSAGAPKQAEVSGSGAQTDDTAAAVAAINTRPLFTIGRRPIARNGAASAARAAALPRARLAGVFVAPGGAEALFTESGKTKSISVHEGDELEGWTVEKIAIEQVTIRAGTASEIIEPVEDKGKRRGDGFSGTAMGSRTPLGANATRQ